MLWRKNREFSLDKTSYSDSTPHNADISDKTNLETSFCQIYGRYGNNVNF